MDMIKFVNYNDGFIYILVVIDVLLKYLWMWLLKNKRGVFLVVCCFGLGFLVLWLLF